MKNRLNMKYLTKILFVILVFISSSLVAASFDCAKARIDIEKMICGDSQSTSTQFERLNIAQLDRKVVRFNSGTNPNAQLALVIGNNQYEYSPLQNPVNDATDMARVLEEIGFEVILKTNLDLRAMKKAIREFGKRLAKSRGVGLFFFAGHGTRVEGHNYLLPINNNLIKDATDLEFEAIYVDEVLLRMEKAKTHFNIIVLDACRNNPYQGKRRSLKRGLAGMEPPKGSIIAFATDKGDTASDMSRSGNNGLYTSHLLKALKRAYQTNQRIDDMFTEVRNQVFEESNRKQEPWSLTSWRAPFCFGGCQTQSISSEICNTSNMSKEVIASSILKSQTYKKRKRNYNPNNVIDGDKNTAWVEGVSGNGINQWIKVIFSCKVKIKKISIISGYTADRHRFEINNRIKKIRISFSNGYQTIDNLEDIMSPQFIVLGDIPHTTQWVKFEIIDIYLGSKYQDTAISEIYFDIN